MKSPEVEARIDALSENPPSYVTETDIVKARKAARKAYREDLTNAVKRELLASPVNVSEIVASALKEIVRMTAEKVTATLGSKSADNLVDAEVRRLVSDNLGKFKPPVIEKMIADEIAEVVKEMVATNVAVTIKEGHW